MVRVTLAVGSSTALLLSTALAQSDTVTFNGTISDTCTVVAGSAGTLAASTDNTVIASSEAGGSAGTATVTTNSTSFEITLAAATAFDSAPASAAANTTFAAEFDASGATTASDVAAGVAQAAGSGTTNLSIDASATKSTGTYEAGSYSLTVTVTCATP